jgi:hypothetical protein
MAVTVRVEEPPAEIEAGSALICTVGAGFEVTVTATIAVALVPPEPDAVAV